MEHPDVTRCLAATSAAGVAEEFCISRAKFLNSIPCEERLPLVAGLASDGGRVRFRIREYVESLSVRLSGVGKARRLAFAVWCCEPLFEEFAFFLSRMMGSENVRLLREVLESAWKNAAGGMEPNGAQVQRARQILESVWWGESDLDEEGDDFLSMAAIELFGGYLEVLDCLQSGSAASAAKTAERILNRIDAELSMQEGIADPLSDPRFVSEVERQKKMVSFLEQGAPLSPDVRTLYRKEPCCV